MSEEKAEVATKVATKRKALEKSICLVVRLGYSDGDSIEVIRGEEFVVGRLLKKTRRMITVYWNRLVRARSWENRRKKQEKEEAAKELANV